MTPDARGRAHGGSSREAFLEATADLLRRQGYGATGLNQIVSRSGAPKGSLYFHFPGGKEQLALEAMTRSGDELRRAITATLSSSDVLAEALGRLLDALASGLQRSGYESGCPIATVTLEQAASSPALRAAADAVFASWLRVIQERLLASGLTAAAAERRALLILSCIEGALILARARHDLAPLEAVRDELVALSS